MNKFVNRMILVFFCVCLVGNVATAQSRVGDPLRFSLSTSAAYTDNRDSAVDAESNTDFYLKPKLSGSANWRRGSLVFYYEPSFRYRTDPSAVQNDDELQHDVSLTLEHSLAPRLTFNVQNRFVQTDDPAIQENGSTLRRDSSYIINWAGIGGKVGIGKHTGLNVQVEHMIKRYDEVAVASESDEDNLNATLTLRRQISKTFDLFMDVKSTIFEYEHTDEIDRDFDSFSAGVGAYKMFGKMLDGNIRLGQKTLSYDDDALSDNDEPYVSVDLTLKPKDTLRLKLSGNYMLKNSDVFPHASQQYSSVNTRLEADFTEMFTFGLAAGYRLGEYDVETVTPEAKNRIRSNSESYSTWAQRFLSEGETSGEEETLIGTIDLTYKINRNTSIKLANRYEDVSSDVGVSFDRNALSLSFSKAF